MSDGLDIPFRHLEGSENAQPTSQLELLADESEDSIARAYRVRKTVENAMGAVRTWRQVADECHRFYSGNQWENNDRMVMQQQRRPVLVFNEIKKVVNAITGLERINRTDVRFVTRALDSNQLQDAFGDLATESCAAVDDSCDAHYERSWVVRDCAIAGMGFYETMVSFDQDLDGKIIKSRLPYNEMVWDTNSQRAGLVDSRWRARKRNLPKEIFKKRWPDKFNIVESSAPEMGEFTIQRYEMVTPYYSLANELANPQVGESSVSRKTIPVIQFQEMFDVTVYRIASPSNPNELIELSERSYRELKEEFKRDGLPLPPAVRQTKSMCRQIYVAHGVELEDPVMLPGNAFTLLCMTGIWDEERKIWTGVVGEMLDPQRVKNKSISTALHFYLTNAKGGVVSEVGTWVNESRAKDEWAKPDAWLQTNEGKLKNWMSRTPVDMPPALADFFRMGTQAITDTMGVSQEMLGMAQGEVANPTQRARVASGLAILGWFFDEINRFKKEEAVVTLEFVREFMTDGRLMTIGGMFNSKAIPLLRQNLLEKSLYTLMVDESVKHNPNLKMQIWNDLQPLIPALLKAGAVKILLYLLKFSPIPTTVTDQIVREVMQQQQQQAQQGGGGQPDGMGGGRGGRGKAEDPRMVAAKVGETQARTQKTIMQARRLDEQHGEKVADLLLRGVETMAKIKGEGQQRQHEAKISTIEMMQNILGMRNGASKNGQNNGSGGEQPPPQQ